MNGSYVGPSRRALYVTLAFVLLSMIPGLFIPAAKPFAYIAPLVYLLIERRRRGRSWGEIGIKARTFSRDFKENWHLILVVAFFLQLPLPLIARARWPAFLEHLRERVPFLSLSALGPLLLTIVVIAFIEELIYRGLLQQRLAWYLNGFLAILLASLVFALQHFTPGAPTVVAADLAFVFIDSIVYGWIFARCRNILVSWSAHVAADLMATAVILLWV